MDITGTAAADRLTDTSGDDSILGLAGNDTITASGGDDTVDGGAGSDLLVVDYAPTPSAVYLYDQDGAYGVSGDANGYNGSFVASDVQLVSFFGVERFEVHTGSGADYLDFSAAANASLITTGAGNDTVFGGTGADTIQTGDGDDVVSALGLGSVVDLGTGVNGLSLDRSDQTAAMSIDIPHGTYSVPGLSGTLSYLGEFRGGAGADTVMTGAGVHDETISGGGGDDVIGVAGGEDVVSGGTGVNTLIVDYSASSDLLSLIGPDGASPLVADADGFSGSLDGGGTTGVAFDGIARFIVTGGSASDDFDFTGVKLGVVAAGGGGDDSLTGGFGSDTLTGGAGSDTLDGGAGVDTAVYAGFAHDYALALTAGAGTVSGGPEGGTDTLTSVENLQFLDGTLTFDTGSTAAQIVRLYDSFLGRAPDAAGFEGYLRFFAAGHTFQDMANNAAASPEFANATAALNDTQYITYVYEHSLHREPDPGGLQNYLNALHDGSLTRTSMIVQAAESPEHVALTAGVVGQGLWIPDEKVESLELLYDAAVQRQPDATGIAGYGALVASGTSYKAIANQMSQSAEFLSHHASQSDADYVDSLYVAEVGRHADPAGLAAYVDQLTHGFTRGDVLYETAFSQEHQSHVLAFYDPLLA